MPKKLEKQLLKEGKKKGLTGDRLRAYIYGTLHQVTGWTRGKGKKKKK